jgi:DNA-binding LacI/PurR family transcriptional regulator
MGEGRKRKTIGFISQTGYDNFPTQMLGGATKAAREHDVNLIRFSMESTRLEDSYQDQLEYILRIIANADLDGLMFLGWMYDFQKDPKAFFGKFEKDKKTPLVCVGSIMDGVPSVGMDGRKYMIELLAHLAEHHSYKNIVFIQPYSPDDRYPAYEEYMKKHGFFKPELVITREEIMIHGDHYAHVRAKKICNILFDERKLEFDALISPFAHEAASILEESMRRGYRIPDDFAVIGWEDGARSKYADPAITSMYFPFFEIGYAACEKMVQIISGEKVPFVTLIPTRLNIRKSCGCNPTDILSECGDLPNKRNKNPTKEELIRRFHSRADISLEALDPEIMINMLFQNKTDENESINRYLNQLLAKASITVHSITMINMIQKDILRFSCFIRQECENETLAWTAERLAYRILAAIHQKMERELGFNEALNRGESHLLQGINQDIVTTFGLDQLLKVIVEGLGKINIKNCFLFLNPDPAMAALEERSVYRFQNGVMSDITQGLDEKFNILSALFPEDRQSIY